MMIEIESNSKYYDTSNVVTYLIESYTAPYNVRLSYNQ